VAQVVVSDIDGKKASEVADKINSSGGSAIAVVGDMLDDAYLGRLVKEAAAFGGGKLHIIVNNAGYTWDGVVHKVRLSTTFIQPVQRVLQPSCDY